MLPPKIASTISVLVGAIFVVVLDLWQFAAIGGF
jgi:hypothetical protein